MRAKIYITQPVAESALQRLRTIADVEFNSDPLHIPSVEELITAVKRCDILYCLLHDRVTKAVIEANPSLKAIVSTAITPANIDTVTATARGIPVTVIPAALLNDATADLAWALLMAVARRVAEADRMARAGRIPGSQSSYFEGACVSGKTLGLLGVGGVGREMAARARGFKMQTLYHDPRRLSAADEAELRLTWVGFDELFSRSDFLSLHVALNPATQRLVDARTLALMKPSAFLINTARGPIVDEQALIVALQGRTIAGAGLDVFATEPDIDARLLALPNVVATAHMGSAVRELREVMAHIVVDNISAVLEGQQAPNCWNPGVYAQSRRTV
jgi:glyoxylate reductase